MEKQLIRSTTSIAANFRAATRARSPREFYTKLCIVLEETDEAEYWVELITDLYLSESQRPKDLLDDLQQVLKIISVVRSRLKDEKK